MSQERSIASGLADRLRTLGDRWLALVKELESWQVKGRDGTPFEYQYPFRSLGGVPTEQTDESKTIDENVLKWRVRVAKALGETRNLLTLYGGSANKLDHLRLGRACTVGADSTFHWQDCLSDIEYIVEVLGSEVKPIEQRLRDAIGARGHTLEKAAEKLKCDVSTVSRILSGKQKPRSDLVGEIEKYITGEPQN